MPVPPRMSFSGPLHHLCTAVTVLQKKRGKKGINSSPVGREGHLWGPVAFSAVCFTRKWAIVYWYCHVADGKNNSRIKKIARRSRDMKGRAVASIQERSLDYNSYDEKVN